MIQQLRVIDSVNNLYSVSVYQLNPNNYDKNSQLFINFNNSCKHIIEKNIEVNYKI
jgi:hypothetical protein